jgi:8-oxo-dGTP diphosphatase
MSEINQDRQRTLMVKGKQVTFTLLPLGTPIPPLEKVTSVAVVPFDAVGNMVAVSLKNRGVDLPGGHMQKDERTFDETARREVMEEACVTLGSVVPACVIQSDFYGTAPDQLTYMLIMTASVKSFEPVDLAKGEQSSGRVVLSVEKFLEEYTAGDKALMRSIVVQAQSGFMEDIKKKIIDKPVILSNPQPF